MTKAAYIIIDIQNDYFPEGKLPLENIHEASAKAAEFLTFVRERNASNDEKIKIIHIRHEFIGEAPFFNQGSSGSQINDVVKPQDDEVVITKNHPNSFIDTNLQQILKDNDIDTLYVSGAMVNICIQGTVRHAVELGYKVTTLRDAIGIRDFEYDDKVVSAKDIRDTVFATLAFGYGELKDTSDVIASLK